MSDAGFPADWKHVDHARAALDELDDIHTRGGVTTPPRAHELVAALRAIVTDQEGDLNRLTTLLEEAHLQDQEPHW